MEIRITEHGMAAAREMLLGTAMRAQNIKPAWTPIQRSVAQLIVFQFNSEGAFLLGRPWKELAPSTLRKKAKKNLDMRRLWATHAMRNSLTRKSDPNNLVRMSPTEFSWGTSLFYAQIHQDGAGHVPQREIFRARPVDIWRWNGYITDHIMGRDLKRRRL